MSEKPKSSLPLLIRSKIRKGLWAEKRVADLLTSRNYEVLCSNLKTPWAQLDLLVQSKPGFLQIIEVKYLSTWFEPELRLSEKQKLRLLRAQQYLQAQHQCSVGLYLAFVAANGRCRFVEIQA